MNLLSFEEALKTYSKGSHRKVIWTCPDCKKSGPRYFKSALKIKKCKNCTLKQTRKSLNNIGENNYWYGKNIPHFRRFGSDNPSWNPNLTDEERLFRKNHRYSEDRTIYNWRLEVYKRDNYTCQCCNKSNSGNLNAHHLNCWKDFKDQRYEIDNGVTLCSSCHKKFHKIHGKTHNTKEQFEIFKSQFPFLP